MSIEKELSGLDIIKEIDRIKKEIDQHRPIPKDIQGRIFQKFRLEWNYHSNAIEGNPYTYGETVAFLLHGITAKGKKLKDHLDIQGHNEAIDFLLGLVKDRRGLNEADIRNLHKMILVQEYSVDAITPSGQPTKKRIQLGQYKTSPNHVKTETGEIHYYASPEETPVRMASLMEWYEEVDQEKEVHPLVLATLFHHKFVEIHPFDDGNGRLGRILMNLILMRHAYPPIIVKQEDRNNYYSVLSQADTGDYLPIIEYMGALLLDSLRIQLKGVLGEDISEPSDIDKEIALFKASLDREDKIKEKRSRENVAKLLRGSLLELLKSLQIRYKKLNELFHRFSETIHLEGYTRHTKDLSFQLDKDISESLIKGMIEYHEGVITFIDYKYTWEGFKKGETPFDIDTFLQISFNEYDYEIDYLKGTQEEAVRKFYHQQLTEEEINYIIEALIKNVLNSIKSKMA